jgi:hypothetical protein
MLARAEEVFGLAQKHSAERSAVAEPMPRQSFIETRATVPTQPPFEAPTRTVVRSFSPRKSPAS